MIYKDQGYFILVDDDFYFDLGDDLRAPEDKFKEVVNHALKVGLFDQSVFDDENILTSSSIQTQYLKICKDAKRKIEPLNNSYKLINPEETIVNSEETLVNSELTPINSGDYPQSKVKESKVNKSKGEKSKPEDSTAAIFLAPYFLKFKNDSIKTLGKIRPYADVQDELDSWRKLYGILIDTLDEDKGGSIPLAEIKVSNVHNLFCLIYESLGGRDRENFSIPYLLKHINRIFSTLNVKARKMQVGVLSSNK